jgi:hypothetical protein
MPFASYTSIGDVARAYQITLGEGNFVVPLERPVPEAFHSELVFAQSYLAFSSSEFAICESLIFPVLKEVWKAYRDQLMLWSHLPLNYDADLSGTPDYFVARMSRLGPWVVDQPYLLVVEAKKDDFERGWGQCLAALLAAQKLNNLPDQVLYGITTNGRTWEFGKLEAATFTHERGSFTLRHLDELYAALHYVFEQCRLQVAGQACPA